MRDFRWGRALCGGGALGGKRFQQAVKDPPPGNFSLNGMSSTCLPLSSASARRNACLIPSTSRCPSSTACSRAACSLRAADSFSTRKPSLECAHTTRLAQLSTSGDTRSPFLHVKYAKMDFRRQCRPRLPSPEVAFYATRGAKRRANGRRGKGCRARQPASIPRATSAARAASFPPPRQSFSCAAKR